jgi:hypothetical protein
VRKPRDGVSVIVKQAVGGYGRSRVNGLKKALEEVNRKSSRPC